MEIKIAAHTAEVSHLKLLINLGETYYPQGHQALTESYLRWFYIDNPAGPAKLIVASEGDFWIGLIVLIPVMLECAGCPQKACFAVNVLTHPEHRGKNLFVKMIRHTRDLLFHENTWLLGHPNASAVPGWKRQKMQFKEPLSLSLSKLRNPLSGIEESQIRSMADLEALPNSFWTATSDRADVHVKYSPDFINWRYLLPPSNKYVVSVVKRSGIILGLRITRRFKGPVDLMVDVLGRVDNFKILFRTNWRPTLIMHSGNGLTAVPMQTGSWKLPSKRMFPFFLTQWTDYPIDLDTSGITLAASDF
jgi:Acetyltransferase (GNAT) domain